MNTMTKEQLRKIFLSRRRQKYFSFQGNWGESQFLKAQPIISELRAKNKNNVLISCYYPINFELNLSQFADSNWIFPKTLSQDKRLMWFFHDTTRALTQSNFGTFEAKIEECFDYKSSLGHLICFIPAIACTLTGERLGYGLGYYDRFIKSMRPYITTIACLPDKDFILKSFPSEMHDEKVDHVIY